MPYLLEMKSITKRFGTVKAVDNVSLRLNPGEVVSLCGENGSGKSTLMKVLCGIYPHGSYEGEIVFAGEVIQATHIRDTERKGIAIIHQELALVKHLTVLENIFLGAEISRHGVLDYDTMTLRCEKLLAQVSLHISPDTRVGDLGLGQQQLVEIAKALNKQVRLLILDEPTASLTEQETAVLLNIIRDLQNHGIACIYISHKLNEVKAISDTICVIRDGQHIGTREAAGMSEDDIITMMVGRELTALYPNEPHTKGNEVLRVENLTAWHPVNRHIKRVNNVSFSLHSGEILGIAGLVGAGRTEAVQCLFGVWPGRWEGTIYIDGHHHRGGHVLYRRPAGENRQLPAGDCPRHCYGAGRPQKRRHRAGHGSGEKHYACGTRSLLRRAEQPGRCRRAAVHPPVACPSEGQNLLAGTGHWPPERRQPAEGDSGALPAAQSTHINP